MSKEFNLDEVISILEDTNSHSKVLEKLLLEHDLKNELNCECEVCSEFRDIEFETPWWPTLDCLSFGMAVLNHPACDEKLSNLILQIAKRSSDGDWILQFDYAYLANLSRIANELLEFQNDSRAEIVRLLKHHPSLTPDVEQQVLESRGWREWPSDEYLHNYTGNWIYDDADDLQSIQLREPGAPTAEELEKIMKERNVPAYIARGLWDQLHSSN